MCFRTVLEIKCGYSCSKRPQWRTTQLTNHDVKWVWMSDYQFPKVTEMVGHNLPSPHFRCYKGFMEVTLVVFPPQLSVKGLHQSNPPPPFFSPGPHLWEAILGALTLRVKRRWWKWREEGRPGYSFRLNHFWSRPVDFSVMPSNLFSLSRHFWMLRILLSHWV